MIKYGDIFKLGNHKLVCGNATLRQDVDTLIDKHKINLILTDPPYGMKAQKKNGVIGGAPHVNPFSIHRGGVNQL